MTLIYLIVSLTIAVFAAILSYVLSIASSRWAFRFGAIDIPTGGRKIHREPIPLFGGVGIALTIIVALVLIQLNGLLPGAFPRQVFGFIAAVLILLVGGITDDRRPLPPVAQLIFPFLASCVVVLSGTGIVQVTSLSSIHGFSLVWWTTTFNVFGNAATLSLPADILTIFWLMLATYATKLLDGLDGLVAGMAVIGSAMVGALTLSTAYFQPGVAVVAGAIGGSFLGFLPRNIHPAKQFLGEVGSTLAGFSLGVLAILSSSKVAIALAVLAIPLADAVFVVVGRLRRGASPFKGDDTHLHFRLLKAGISHGAAVRLLWATSFAAGVIALSLQTRGKIFLLAALVALTGLSSWFMARIAARRKDRI